MNRQLAVHRPLLLASVALGAMLVLVTWSAGLAADSVAALSTKPLPSGPLASVTNSHRPTARRASKAAQDPVANATSHSIMGTACAGANSSAPMFTVCDPGDYSATCCDDGVLVETLCKDGPTSGTVCENSPWGFTPTHCPADSDSDKPVDIPTYCAGGEKLYTECPDRTLHTICKNSPSHSTVCANAPGGMVPTFCPNGQIYTICYAAESSLATACPPLSIDGNESMHR